MPKSKKPSATSTTQRKPVTYFVDHNLGTKTLPVRLRALGAQVEILSEHFAPNAEDVAWIPKVASKGWVILTRDRNIARRSFERDAVLSTGARYVCIAGGNLRGDAVADLVERHFELLDAVVSAAPAPLLVRVTKFRVHFLQDDRWTVARKCHSNHRWWRRRGK